jgi:hypothetical protein
MKLTFRTISNKTFSLDLDSSTKVRAANLPTGLLYELDPYYF